MTKTELVQKMADAAKTTKADAGRALDALVQAITDDLKAGQKVAIAGLGILRVKDRPARVGSESKTGESINIPAKK